MHTYIILKMFCINIYIKCFAGFNLTIFAYGQTGSGKSHTMGTSDSLEIKDKTEEGIIPLSVKDIFREISIKGKENFRVKASFLEVIYFLKTRNSKFF